MKTLQRTLQINFHAAINKIKKKQKKQRRKKDLHSPVVATSSIFVSFQIFSPLQFVSRIEVKFNFSGCAREKQRQAGFPFFFFFFFDRDSVLEDKLRARLVRIDNRARGVERVSRVKCLKIAPPGVTLDSSRHECA